MGGIKVIEEEYSTIYKRLIRRFIISSFILLSVFMLKQFIIHYQIVQEENTSYIVNIAGRQRMLSQKVVKDMSLIQLDQTISDDERYKTDMEDSLELWKKSHYELLDLNKSETIFSNNSSRINQMWQSHCALLWVPALFRRSMATRIKRPRCRFRKTRICSTFAGMPAMTMSTSPLTRRSWSTSANA